MCPRVRRVWNSVSFSSSSVFLLHQFPYISHHHVSIFLTHTQFYNSLPPTLPPSPPLTLLPSLPPTLSPSLPPTLSPSLPPSLPTSLSLSLSHNDSSYPLILISIPFETYHQYIFIKNTDKNYFDRRIVLFLAIVFWSIATSAAGAATNLTQLVDRFSYNLMKNDCCYVVFTCIDRFCECVNDTDLFVHLIVFRFTCTKSNLIQTCFFLMCACACVRYAL